MKEPNILGKAVLNILIAAAIILILIFIFPKILGFFIPFVIGWIIAMITNPLVRFMEKRIKILRKHSSAIIIIGALSIVILVIYLTITVIGRELAGLFADLPQMYADLEASVQSATSNLTGFFKILPSGFQGFMDNINGHITEYMDKFMGNLTPPSISDAGILARNVADIFFKTIITILSSYFFIAEREVLVQQIKKITPPSIYKQYGLVMQNFKTAVGGYFKAQFKIMLVLTVIIFAGMEILQVNYSFFIAFGIAVVDFLPIFGAGAILWPWALIDFLSGNYFNAVGVLVIYLVCQVVRQILQPKMVGDSIGLSPLLTLFFMYVGYKLKGIFGLILGLPIGMVLINFYKSGVFDNTIHSLKVIIKKFDDLRKY